MFDRKKPTEILKEEHQKVLQKLDALEDAINHLDKGGDVPAKLAELAAFFKTDFWIHFSKEEEALFPEIEKFLPREGGPVGVMLMEHEDLRKTNTEFQRGIEQYSKDSRSTGREIIQRHGVYFINVLRGHIDKEDNILFMMADMHLDRAQLEKVLRLFHEIETRGEKESPVGG